MDIGEFGPVAEADAAVQNIVDQVRQDLQNQFNNGDEFAMYTALFVRVQVVAGTNYLVKVEIAPNNCLHVMIFQPLPGPNNAPLLEGAQAGHTNEDHLIPFA